MPINKIKAKLKNIKSRKIPYYLLLGILTIGASLIVGFLSFGGLYAIWPILPLAGLAMFLSVAYEGEIYSQNIKGALNKLFLKSNYLQKELANEFLVDIFPTSEDSSRPQFFKDYEAQLKFLHQFGDKKLDKESRARKKAADKKLKAMEKWFAEQLVHMTTPTEEEKTDYQLELHEWLRNNKSTELEAWQAKLNKREKIFSILKVFSIVSAFAMGLGTTYLLAGEFAAITFLASIPLAGLPAIIIPAAVIAGVAYGLLTYNAATDMVQNETIQKWWRNTKNSYHHDPLRKFLPQALIAVFLVSLAVVLTVCTAGTWWTIAKNARPIYEAMRRMPGFIMGVIVPVITGLSSLIFITQNTFETLEMLKGEPDTEKKSQKSYFQRVYNFFEKEIKQLKSRENNWQIANPFRIFLKLTFTPLRLLAFAGHLISIGLTSDRVPGVPEIISALLGIISEGFEDAHYFLPHNHSHVDGQDVRKLLAARFDSSHGHNHNADIPTRLLKALFWPVQWAAIKWDVHFSQRNGGPERDHERPELSEKEAVYKHTDKKRKHSRNPERETPISEAWEFEQNIAKIERFKQKQPSNPWVDSKLAKEKTEGLSQLQNDLRQISKQTKINPSTAMSKMSERIATERQKEIYNRHRLWNNGEKTATQALLDDKLETSSVMTA